MTNYSDEHSPRVLSFIRAFLPDSKVYAYGSRARGDNKNWSDLDLMIDNGNKISFQELDDIKVALQSSSIPYSVDLHDLHRTDLEFLKSIETQMKTLV